MDLFDLRPIEDVDTWLLEVRRQDTLVGYVGRNPVVGSYRYYRGRDGFLAREAHDLAALLVSIAQQP